jgi:valyl-tRNA synthetase
VGDLIDLAGERARLAKDIATRDIDIDKSARKLANPDFVSRAPEEVVEENRERLAEAEAARARLAAMLERLSVLA